MSQRESENHRMSCCLKGTHAVTQASEAARAFGEAQWLSEDELARLCIVVEELIANLYDHGGVGSEEEVRLELASESAGLRIVIVDFGTPFDPRQPPKKDDRPERGGGAGIEIVQAWAHLVNYEVTDHGNRLELILPVST
jgi:anti-sigma regulatory factor (Ser/Thr protein kinase)